MLASDQGQVYKRMHLAVTSVPYGAGAKEGQPRFRVLPGKYFRLEQCYAPTIAAAIDSSTSGDVVEIGCGVYVEWGLIV